MIDADLHVVTILDLARAARADSDYVRAACREMGLEIIKKDMAEIVDVKHSEAIITRARELEEEGYEATLKRLAKPNPESCVAIIPKATTEQTGQGAQRRTHGETMAISTGGDSGAGL